MRVLTFSQISEYWADCDGSFKVKSLLMKRAKESPGAVGVCVHVWLRDVDGSLCIEVDG